jgi:hypothetical protein
MSAAQPMHWPPHAVRHLQVTRFGHRYRASGMSGAAFALYPYRNLMETLMRLLFAGLVSILSASAWGGPLIEHVESKLAQRLANLTQISSTDHRVRELQTDLDELLLTTGEQDVALVATPELFARVFPGRVVAVNVALASAPKAQRMLVMAHELGHVVHRDYDRYMAWASRAEQAMSVVLEEGAEREFNRQLALLSELQHAMEYDADEYASRILVRLNLSIRAAVAVLQPFELLGKTASHPAVMDRVARLLRREADEQRLQSPVD